MEILILNRNSSGYILNHAIKRHLGICGYNSVESDCMLKDRDLSKYNVVIAHPAKEDFKPLYFEANNRENFKLIFFDAHRLQNIDVNEQFRNRNVFFEGVDITRFLEIIEDR